MTHLITVIQNFPFTKAGRKIFRKSGKPGNESLTKKNTGGSGYVHILQNENQKLSAQVRDYREQIMSLNELNEKLKDLDNFRGRMMRMIIHDLKNPLNIILNTVESGEVTGKAALKIRQVSFEMLDLITNILDIGKLEETKMKISPENVELNQIIEKYYETYYGTIRNSSIEFKVNITGKFTVFADKQILERVIGNLLSNAIKFTPPFGSVGIRAMQINGMIRIEINDNGVGIPGNLLSNIFKEYISENDKAYVYTNSTGLGLYYCKMAVEAHGGKIDVISKEGEGTRVWFMLPEGKEDQNFPDVLCKPGLTLNHFFPEDEDILLVRHHLELLRGIDIHEVSTILRILSHEDFRSNPKLIKWKEIVEAAVFSTNEKLFHKLLNMS